MLPTASGRWILVYEGANTVSEQTFHSLQCLFLWRQLCRSARLSVYSEEGARCDSRIHARRKGVVSMLPAGWVAPLPCLFRIYRMHRLTNLDGCFWSASSHCIWTSTNG